MSEEQSNPPAVIEPVTDLDAKDLAIIKQYADEGLPHIAMVDDVKMRRILDLYLSGKTYRQIASVMGLNKAIVLYLSHKFNWFAMRQEYLTDLEQSMRGRVIEAKLVNQDFLLQLIHVWQKKIGQHMNKYLATDDTQFVNAIDLKEIDKLLKTIEMLHRLDSDKSSGGKTPAVGLNLGDGVTVERMDDGKVEITPKNKAIGDFLKKYADIRREEENVKKKM